jgi:hypothetical protein
MIFNCRADLLRNERGHKGKCSANLSRSDRRSGRSLLGLNEPIMR